MIKHLEESKELGLKVFFDPGQQLFTFNKKELDKISDYANYLILNSYEWEEFMSRI
jgi:sugar/nucleoside kinase (ribokinase family)